MTCVCVFVVVVVVVVVYFVSYYFLLGGGGGYWILFNKTINKSVSAIHLYIFDVYYITGSSLNTCTGTYLAFACTEFGN